MKIQLFDKKTPPEKYIQQALSVAEDYAFTLMREGVPVDNGFYPLYQWALVREIEFYLKNVGNKQIKKEVLFAFEKGSSELVLGFLLYSPLIGFSKGCSVNYMAVSKIAQGNGIGSKLLSSMIDRYPSAEVTCFASKVGFYEQAGFVPYDIDGTQVIMSTSGKRLPGNISILDRQAIVSSLQAVPIQREIEKRLGQSGCSQAINDMKLLETKLMIEAQSFMSTRVKTPKKLFSLKKFFN